MKPNKKLVSPLPAEWEAVWQDTKTIPVNRLVDEARPEYVASVDLMGAKGWMAGSIRRAAQIVGVIHLAALKAAIPTGARVYPIIDGVYIVSPSKSAFRKTTHQTMRLLARSFDERGRADRFLVRGGIAYGRVLHGESLAKLHDDLQIEQRYSRCIAIGAAIQQAHEAEGKAPPFGFYVDMTARSVASAFDSPYISTFDRWWRTRIRSERELATRFGTLLDQHFAYLATRRRESEYALDRLEEHRALAHEYFRLGVPEAAT